MDFNQITKASDAIAYIKAHPGMTTAQLQQIARQMGTGIGNAKVKLTYSGYLQTSQGSIPAWKAAEGIKGVYPAGQVGTITGTQFEILVKDATFTDALKQSVNNNLTNFNKVYDGTDLSGNGVIDSQKEMFGTDAASTAAAKLAALDTNKDGFVDSKDTGWGTLRLWKDANGDGVSQADELFTLASQGVAKLGVAHTTENDRTVAGNVVDWQANWYKSGGVVGGAYGDVLFETNDEDSWYVGSDTTQSQPINPEALLLPLSRGYGVMKALHLTAGGSTAA